MTKLNQIEAMRAAGLAAPALRAGRVTRKIKVVRDGAVVREVDGIELGKALLARAGIELDVLPLSKRCPRCDGPKSAVSIQCHRCRSSTAKYPKSKETCGKCGRKKARSAFECRSCLALHLRANPRLVTTETRAKLSKIGSGRRYSAETREKISAANRGRKRSPEAIAKSASSRTGARRTPEMCARISAATKGRKLSRAQRSRIGAAMKAMWAAKRAKAIHKPGQAPSRKKKR